MSRGAIAYRQAGPRVHGTSSQGRSRDGDQTQWAGPGTRLADTFWSGTRFVAPSAVRPDHPKPRPTPDQIRRGDDPGAWRRASPRLASCSRWWCAPAPSGGYVLIAGERRWRAAQLAGLREIPALLRTSDERSALAEAVVENLQREDLTPLEEAAAYTQLLEDFAMTHEQVGSSGGEEPDGGDQHPATAHPSAGDPGDAGTGGVERRSCPGIGRTG